jgi:hypothetical protein
MPAYAHPSGLLLTFHRDGEPPEQQIAPNGLRAVSAAMKMLALKDKLRDGDRLTVEADTAPPISPGE